MYKNVQNREPKSKLITPTTKINKIKMLRKLLYIEKILTVQYYSPDTCFLLLSSCFS